MKLTVDQRALAAAISAGGAVASKNSPVPVLNNVRLSATGMSLGVASTNGDTFAEAAAEAVVDREGAITVPAAHLSALVAKFPAGASVSLEMDGPHLIVKCGRSRSKLATLPADQFPSWGDDNFAAAFTMAPETFAATIARARQACGNDELMPIIGGVFMHAEGERLWFAATNRFVVTEINIELPEGAGSCPSVIIPASTADIAAKVLKGCGEVAVSVSAGKIAFAAGPVRLASKLVDGQYPEYRRFFPPRGGAPIEFARRDFADALDRAELATEEGVFSAVVVIPRGEVMELKGANSLGGEVREEVEGEVAPDFKAFGFNPRYMRIVLAAFADAERITIEQNDPKAGHFVFSEETPDTVMTLATVAINSTMAA